jgi:hypothetical protein
MSFLPLHALRAKVADERISAWQIPTEEADHAFGLVLSLLEPAIERSDGRLTVSDVRERVADGRMQLIVISDDAAGGDLIGALVTEFCKHPQGDALNIALLGGRELHRWIDRLLEIERWAKSEGCRWIELSGRFGWERVLRGLDYRRTAVLLSKELS